MITEKTLFINKIYDKFHKSKLETKDHIYLCFYKYRNYFIDAPREESLKFFEIIFFYNRLFSNKRSLDNFEIKTLHNEESYEFKANDAENIYFNKYQVSFFLFVHKSITLLNKLDDKKDQQLLELERNLKLDVAKKLNIEFSEEELTSAFKKRKENKEKTKKKLLF
jgi:hypothetical protein